MTQSVRPAYRAAVAPAALALNAVGPGPLPRRRWVIGPRRMTIGRQPSCDLVLPVPQVSRKHAAIWSEGGIAWVVDLGSANGTMVNERVVGVDPQPLRRGDRLRVAGVVLAVSDASAPGATTSGSDSAAYAYPSLPEVLPYEPIAGGAPGYRPEPGGASGYQPLGGPGDGRMDVDFQAAQQIHNAGRDIRMDHRVTHHNRFDVDVNPLPRSQIGRVLIYVGVTTKLVGTLMATVWMLRYLEVFFDYLSGRRPFDGFAGIPEPHPWLSGGIMLTVVGTGLWIIGAIAALSARRRRNELAHR